MYRTALYVFQQDLFRIHPLIVFWCKIQLKGYNPQG